MLNGDINIVFITDESYLLPTAIAVRSLIRNANETSHYNINLIMDDACRKKWEAEYTESVSADGKHIRLNYIEPDTSIGQERFTHVYVSSAALQKFSIPALFPDLDKILYLDDDILIKGDVAELYDKPLDDHYAAVVKDLPSYFNPVYTARRQSYGLKEYFNSGVMLLNLKKMREDSVREKLIQFKEQEVDPIFMDQDAFNVVFHENVSFLSPRYNYIVGCETVKSRDEIADFYGVRSEEITDARVIIHLAGGEKPWKGGTGVYSQEWLSCIETKQEMAACVDSILKKQEQFNREMIRREEELSRQNAELYEMVNVLNQFMKQAQGQITSLLESNNEHNIKAKIFQDTNESFHTRISGLETRVPALEARIPALENTVNEMYRHSVIGVIKRIAKNDEQQ